MITHRYFKFHLLPPLLIGMLVPVSGASAPPNDLREILSSQIARYPHLEIQDLYKLVYQGTLGPAHVVSDPAAARRWLEREISELGDAPVVPVVERLPPDGRLVRVNLRPYLDAGGDPDRLLEAFVETAKQAWGSLEILRQNWSEVTSLAESGELPFPPDSLIAYFVRQESDGFPAVHHSPNYQTMYRPAYRVVLRPLLP